MCCGIVASFDLGEHYIRSRPLISRTVAAPDLIPALGSKVISATASPWLSHHDDVSTAMESRGEEIFKPAIVHGGPVSSAAGIPVLIERSVV